MNLAREVREAEARIRPHIRETMLIPSPAFDGLEGAQVYLKCENLQHSGSFKVRGALSKALTLTPEQLNRGVITASTGNHGAAVAFALSQLNAQATVFVPEGASPSKLANITRHGGVIREHGSDSGETELFARDYADRNGMTFLSPYNDPQVIGGQGTIAVELERQLDPVDAVVVAIGGGGLIAGIASYFKAVRPHIQIIGCSPANSPVMIRSVEAGRLIEYASTPTLSDGTAGGIEPDAITFPVVRDHVDELITVDEAEIAAGMLSILETHSLVVEGAAGVAVAAYRKLASTLRGKNTVIVLCGGNVGLSTLRRVVCEPSA